MFSLPRKVIGASKWITALPSLNHPKLGNCRYALHLGYEPHFAHLQNCWQQYPRDTLVYCYDNVRLNLAFEMMARNKNVLTYVSETHFETVKVIDVAKSVQQVLAGFQGKSLMVSGEQSGVEEQMDKVSDDLVSEFLKTHRFVIQKSFLDYHPYEAYLKVCGYLDKEVNQTIVSEFRFPRISQVQLPDHVMLAPLMNELRKEYLDLSGPKLLRMPRKKKGNSVQAQQTLSKWKNICYLDKLRLVNCELSGKLNWAIQHNYGNVIPLRDAMEGLFRHYYYAGWL